MRMCPHRAAKFSETNTLTRLRETLFRPAKLIEHQRQLQSEGDRLGVNAVTASDHRSFLVSACLFANCFSQCRQVISQNLGRLGHLHCQGSVENVGGSQTLM